MDRRQFLRSSAASGVAAAVGVGAGTTRLGDAGRPGWVRRWPGDGRPGGRYPQGVVSGLESPTTTVIWTRVQPPAGGGDVPVQWAVAEDASMRSWRPGRRWRRPVPITRSRCGSRGWRRVGPTPTSSSRSGPTAPSGGPGPCHPPTRRPTGSAWPSARAQNYGTGLYPAHRAIAAEDLDGFVFLGDYIYESSGIAEDLGSVGELFVPAPRADTTRRATDLATYRVKYKLYRSDPDLQANHANHPLVPVWDDHEFRNDYDRESAAADPARVAAAYQAWFEYMPVMPVDGGTRIHRSLRWGNLAELFLLGNDPHMCAVDRPSFGARGGSGERAGARCRSRGRAPSRRRSGGTAWPAGRPDPTVSRGGGSR